MIAGEAATAANPRVYVFGECVHLLRAQGNAEAAIQMEKLGNKLAQIGDGFRWPNGDPKAKRNRWTQTRNASNTNPVKILMTTGGD